MRLIDADALEKSMKKTYCNGCNSYNGVRCRACWVDDACGAIDSSPTIEAEPVVRCKDCEHFREFTREYKESAECVEGADGDCFLRALYSDGHKQFSAVSKDDYCSHGKKMRKDAAPNE